MFDNESVARSVSDDYSFTALVQPKRTDRRKLFTLGNPKTEKGESYGYLTAVLHLAPFTSAAIHKAGGGFVDVCPAATVGCITSCLNLAGRGGIMKVGARTNEIQEARKRKTRELFSDRAAFISACVRELSRLERKAFRMGLKLAVRVNGTSDLPFLAHALASRFPHVQFYDYTKLTNFAARKLPNYHLTFSRAESNAAEVFQAIRANVNVAVVFSTKRGAPLPSTYLGRPVIDGDAHDLRFLDPKSTDGKGLIIGLRAKGPAKRDCSGFVVPV